jgi:hypothetical protein
MEDSLLSAKRAFRRIKAANPIRLLLGAGEAEIKESGETNKFLALFLLPWTW